MELTAFGMALLPLCVAAIAQPPWQLYLVLLTGAFGAATPLAIGGFGLPPGVPPACLFLFHVGLQYMLGAHYPGERQAWRTLEPFLLTASYALVTALLVPRMFTGSFTVWPQKLIPPYDIPIPLAPGLGNVTQSLYLLIGSAIMSATALYATNSRFQFARLLGAYLASGYVVVAICAWQMVHKLTGLWFPADFLYSNPGWVIFPGQTLGIVPRINGPFSEPAALALFLSGIIFCCTWLMLHGYSNRMASLLLPFALLALLASTSTTGFTVLGIGGAILVAYGLTRARRRVALRIFAFAVPLTVIFIAAAMSLATLSEQVEQSVAMVMRQTLVKVEGDSFASRTRWDLDSLAVLPPSFGLGAGWGSVRASSLVPGLLANLGIIGCGLLLWFAVRLVNQVGAARRLAASREQRMTLDGLSAASIGSLTAATVSAPAINAIDFYLLLGALIACASKVQADARARYRTARTRPAAVDATPAAVHGA